MSDFNEKIIPLWNRPVPPPETHRPHYTVNEEIAFTTKHMRETMERLLRFEERLKCDYEDFKKTLASDNVIFKNTFSTAHETFLQEVKNAINIFEGNTNADYEIFKSEINNNYSGLVKQFDEIVNDYIDKSKEQYDSFTQAINTRLDNYNNSYGDSFNDYQQKLTTEINMFEQTVNTNLSTMRSSLTNMIETFTETWETAISTRLNNQDSKITDAELYMKTNLIATVTTLIGDMRANGEFSEIINGELFNDLEEKIDAFGRVNVQTFGATGTGEIDDTEAIKTALLSGKNVYFPEGTYLISEPLYVNVNTTSIMGSSSRSVIKASENFPNGEAMIVFYSPDGDYYDRNLRIGEHGMLWLEGNNKLHDGVRFGGAVGTDKEGHVEGSMFKGITVNNCDSAFLWGAHCYRTTLLHCDSHNNNYALKTTDDITDSGELFTCVNCGFWSGSLMLKNCGEIVFTNCTIHTKAKQAVGNIQCTHYFEGVQANFDSCHIEIIVRNQDEYDEIRPTTFYALNASVNIKNAYAVVSGNYITLDNVIFKCETTNNYPSEIFVEGGQWKYYFGRCKVTHIANGLVRLKEIPMKYTFDGIKIPAVYSDTPMFFTNMKGDFDYIYGLSATELEETTITATNGGSYKQFDINVPVTEKQDIGFYKKVNVENAKTCVISGNVNNTQADNKTTFTSQIDIPSIIMFLDSMDNLISFGSPYNADVYDAKAVLDTTGRFVAVPNNAKTALIGFNVQMSNKLQKTINVQSSLRFEFI